MTTLKRAIIATVTLFSIYIIMFFVIFDINKSYVETVIISYQEKGHSIICVQSSRIVEYDIREWIMEKSATGQIDMQLILAIHAVYVPINAVLPKLDFRKNNILNGNVSVDKSRVKMFTLDDSIDEQRLNMEVNNQVSNSMNGTYYDIR